LPAERVRRHLAARFNPLRGLTPERLTAALDSFKRGQLRSLAFIMESLEERDDVISGVVGKTRQAVARQGYEILLHPSATGSARLAEEQKAVLEDFYANLETTHALATDECGGVPLLVRQMMDAVGKRYAAHQVQWLPEGGALRARLWFTPLYFFEATTGALRFVRDERHLTTGDPLPPGEWLLTTGPGLMIPTAVAWMYKHLPLQDWLAFCGKFGLPGVVASTSAQPGTPEWDANVQAVAGLANDWAAVFHESSQVHLLEARGAGQLPFAPLVERMDRAIIALWRGSDLGTLSGQDQNGASLQREESEILQNDFAALISETLNKQLTRWVLEWHFGPDTPQLAYFQLKTAPRQTTELDLRVDEFLIGHGADLPLGAALRRYGRQPAREGEAVLRSTEGSRLPEAPVTP
jgi:phage gp29-like protein